MSKPTPAIETRISGAAKDLKRAEAEHARARVRLEDALAKGHDSGYSVSWLSRLAGLRRERTHYSIQRAYSRRTNGSHN